jgi:Uri superfamily endonuclease
VEVGRWGHLDVEPGYYIYVGSALGPGGLRARVSRHFRKTKAKHWHIDYLREAVDAVCAWYSYRHKSREHQWARAIRETMQTSAVKGFGCSDCGCYSHLLMTAKEPSLVQFSDAVGGTIESRSYRVFEE